MSFSSNDRQNSGVKELAESTQNSASPPSTTNGSVSITLGAPDSVLFPSAHSLTSGSPSRAHAKLSISRSLTSNPSPTLAPNSEHKPNQSLSSTSSVSTPAPPPIDNKTLQRSDRLHSLGGVVMASISAKEWSSRDRAKNAYGMVSPSPFWTIGTTMVYICG